MREINNSRCLLQQTPSASVAILRAVDDDACEQVMPFNVT